MGALLDAINAQIVTLGLVRTAEQQRSSEEIARIDAAVTALSQASTALTDNPELETLYASIAALNILPAAVVRGR